MTKELFLQILLFIYFCLKRKAFCLILQLANTETKSSLTFSRNHLVKEENVKKSHISKQNCLCVWQDFSSWLFHPEYMFHPEYQGDHCCLVFQERVYLLFLKSHTEFRNILSRIKLWELSHKNSHCAEQGWVSGFLLCCLQISTQRFPTKLTAWALEG